MFRTAPLFIIRSFSLHTQQTCMTYPLLCVQWKTPDDGQRNSPKHVEFYSKKIEKLVHLVAGWSCASACNTDTTPTQPHRNSNTHRTKNNTTNVVIQQNSRKLLMMDILMSETFWAHKKWNKIASDIKLVFYCSAIYGYVLVPKNRIRHAAYPLLFSSHDFGHAP